jgi:predicted phage gp36 major capsid-like protein
VQSAQQVAATSEQQTTGANAVVTRVRQFLDRPRERLQARFGCANQPPLHAGVAAGLTALLTPAMPALLALLAVYPLPLYAMVRIYCAGSPCE